MQGSLLDSNSPSALDISISDKQLQEESEEKKGEKQKIRSL